MPAFSFIHCADVHLGAPVRGLGRMPSGLQKRLRDAPTDAFGRIVTAAIDRDVDAVIVAGDLFDAAERNLTAQARLRDELIRLDGAGIRTLIAAGNHDPLGSLGRGISLPERVHVFGESVEPVVLRRGGTELAHVYGVSYARAVTYRNLAADFPGQPPGPFNIAVLHTNVGDRPGYARYAPCRLSHLLDKGFDYWALGHVHTRETLHADRPVVHYPGNPQALHTGEPGARGATLVKVSDGGRAELEAVWTDTVRWHRKRTAIDDMTGTDELLGAYAEIAGELRSGAPDRMHLVRWTLSGSGPLHAQLARPAIEQDLADAVRASEGIRGEGGVVWLERIELATRPERDVERLRGQQDYLGDMLRLAEQLRDGPPVALGEVGEEHAPAPRDPLSRQIREVLGELLEGQRLRRALGDEPWALLPWNEIVARAEALAIDHLAPEESE